MKHVIDDLAVNALVILGVILLVSGIVITFICASANPDSSMAAIVFGSLGGLGAAFCGGKILAIADER